MKYPENFDVIVVGAGHAGVEAALASARMGSKTLLLTHNIETIGQMSCNPSIGGIGKGHLVREIDALGGVMALACDMSGIQFKILNSSKGPAVQATRVQADRILYKAAIRHFVENQENLFVFQQAVDDILLSDDKAVGVKTQIGIEFYSKTVVLTAGTFLNGKIHVGLQNYSAGRAGDPTAIALSSRLKELKLPQGRLKTGTPPRIDGRSIDISKMQEMVGDGYLEGVAPVFSVRGSLTMHPQHRSCWATRTNEKTHEILRSGFDQSPMFTGVIEGVGPRYCPSIEDKINRFADKDSHQIILEPEGLTTNEYYPNGISTSLPFEIQYHAIRSMPGLENAYILRPGYAIEYDYFDPTSLNRNFESKCISNLFFAGQINGTTGYEEAAAQGIYAGINASLKAKEKDPFYLGRENSYIGVLVDDLITKGVTEPYRMFTSRAEYRLSLREDNADIRLTPFAKDLGLISDQQWSYFCKKTEKVEIAKTVFEKTVIPASKIVNKENAKEILGTSIEKDVSLAELLKRPGVKLESIKEFCKQEGLKADSFEFLDAIRNPELYADVIKQIEVHFKYEGYIKKQKEEVVRLETFEKTLLPKDFDYSVIPGLSTEVRQKLTKMQPETLGMASRISGVPPAAISILLIYLKKYKYI